jgi:hypothetical protein
MRKLMSAAVFLLLVLAVPSISAAESGHDAAFLASLAQQAQSQAGPSTTQDPLSGLGTPAPVQRSCSISRDCGDGTTAACTGTYSCVTSQTGVNCDNVEYSCPNYCYMEWTCCNGIAWCQSFRGDCGVTAAGCNGRPQNCFGC